MAKKLLFIPFCNGAGHAGRMLVIAKALRERFDGAIEFAGTGNYGALFPRAGFRFHEIGGPEPTLYRGKAKLARPYTQKTSIRSRLRDTRSMYAEMIARELKLYEAVNPDLVIWDGRSTVTISAEVAGIPFMSVIDAMLIPHSRVVGEFPRIFGPRLGALIAQLPQRGQEWLFERILDMAFSFYLRFVNQLRSSFCLQVFRNLSELIVSLRTVIVPNPVILSPIIALPPNFHYAGPIVWEPEMELPEPVKRLDNIIYITMGTTGSPGVFKPLLQTLASMPKWPVVVTVGDLVEVQALKPWPEHIHVYPFLPGIEVAKRARLMICHGALATMVQALSNGVPVLTIPRTLPHEIWSNVVGRLGVGLKLYPFDLTAHNVRTAMERLLTEETLRRAAQELAPRCQMNGAPERAAELILSELARV